MGSAGDEIVFNFFFLEVSTDPEIAKWKKGVILGISHVAISPPCLPYALIWGKTLLLA